ncbi:cystatin-F isoform X1 [Monodelphis domestica]|uniref:cystatin-F isoform X1 n=1 Tax=Monodelphis domestica TaxID=13616 RepID=UPI0024E24E22|nr:cystatin-F isoform X1 [Monodelphis domestica]
MRTTWSWLIFWHLTLADLASASSGDECLPCMPVSLDVPKHAKWITKEKCRKHGSQVYGYYNSSGLYAGNKPGLPKVIKPTDPRVQKAARFAVERFNNCTNDLFLFKELCIDGAMVQLVKGLKYMIEMHISRTICKKREHSNLDNCDFQTDITLKQVGYLTSLTSSVFFFRVPCMLDEPLPFSECFIKLFILSLIWHGFTFRLHQGWASILS